MNILDVIFGSNSWLCKKLGLCRKPPILSEPEPPKPPEPPLEPPEPPSTNWKGLVCKWSKQRARFRCLHREEREFSSKPPLCTIHKIEPVEPPIPDIWFHGLSHWEWFRYKAWEKKNQEQAEESLLQTGLWLKKHRIRTIASPFFFLSDGKEEHEHVNKKTPWVFENGAFNLEKYNDRFWELFIRYLEIHRLININVSICGLMAGGYNIWPFQNNHQGIIVSNLMDRKIRPIIQNLFENIMLTYQKLYGKKFKPLVKIINEARHRDGRQFHEIAYFHQEIWEKTLSKYTDLKNLIIDVHASEGGQLELVYHGKNFVCPKLAECDKGGKHGKIEYARHRIGETHGYSNLNDFLMKTEKGKTFLQAFLGSGNPYWFFTEDAGSKTKTGQAGYWKSFNFSTAKQQYEMSKYIWREARRMGKRIIFGSFPAMETLKIIKKGGKELILPDYSVENLEKEGYGDKLIALARGWLENYG